jgi:hypothetical protein
MSYLFVTALLGLCVHGSLLTAVYAPTTPGAQYVYQSISRKDNKVIETIESSRIVRKVAEKQNSKAKLLSVDWVIDGKVEMVSEIEVSDQGLAYCSYDNTKLSAPFQLLKLPSKAQDTWMTTLRWEADLMLDIECTNEGIEIIEVPAGKFLAIRVKAECVTDRKGMCATTWYAPGVGPVKCVYTLGKESTEVILKSFKPGKE